MGYGQNKFTLLDRQRSVIGHGARPADACERLEKIHGPSCGHPSGIPAKFYTRLARSVLAVVFSPWPAFIARSNMFFIA